MSLTLTPDAPPFACDAEGVIRVAKTRVTLDTVVEAFREGTSPEKIVEQYPSLNLAQVYSAIGYYLRHQAEVEHYLRERHELAEKVRQENEARHPSAGIRDRLSARRHSQG
jgi:uncharacterized protein (DUF433 family)